MGYAEKDVIWLLVAEGACSVDEEELVRETSGQ
jgi:hypothetical protein